MLRIVLDTNVMISAIINNGTSRRLLREIIQDKHILITSEQILTELESVLSRAKFKMDENEIKKIIGVMISSCDVKKTKSKFKIVKDDPDDDMFINIAYDGKADCIVSGDKDLLKIKKFRSVKIFAVKEMLEIMLKDK